MHTSNEVYKFLEGLWTTYCGANEAKLTSRLIIDCREVSEIMASNVSIPKMPLPRLRGDVTVPEKELVTVACMHLLAMQRLRLQASEPPIEERQTLLDFGIY